MDQQNPFKWRHYEADIILLCVRCYVRYSLSSRDLDETYLKVKKGWMYLYRAVDSASATPWNFGSVPPAMPKQPKPSSRKRWLRLIPPPLV